MPENKKILITDDEPFIVKIIQKRLTARHFDVITAASGKEAIEKAKKDKPDLIVLDQSMPELTGEETCKLLKSDPETQKIPIVMFTALEHFGLEQKCILAGAEGVAYKPTVSDLVETIRKVLAGESLDPEDKEFNL